MAARKLGSRTIHEPYTGLLASRALITKPRPCVLVKNGNHTVELDGAASSLGPASSISPVPAGAWLSLTDAGHSSSSIRIYSTYGIVSSVQSQTIRSLRTWFLGCWRRPRPPRSTSNLSMSSCGSSLGNGNNNTYSNKTASEHSGHSITAPQLRGSCLGKQIRLVGIVWQLWRCLARPAQKCYLRSMHF